MRNKFRIIFFVFAISLLGLFAFAGPGEKYFDIAKSLDIFATLFKEVNAYYVDEVDPKKLINTGIKGMLESLDPYTDFIPEEDLEAFSIQTTGQYAGVGALIGVINKKTIVTEPYVGFPAYRAGLRVGDELISVDGQKVQGKGTGETSALLKGKPHTEVEVVVKRIGQKEELRFKIIREKIKISNVSFQGLIQGDIGYIKLDDFTPGAAKEVEEALIQLKEKGAKKMVLDLRDNPGGLLYEAVNIVNIFIPKGLEVVATKGKVQDWNKSYTTLNNPVDTEIPLTILTSGGSASASEIVAGSLQDYDRAILIGQKTFGKGLVQTTRQLSYNTQLKITTAKYYIPSGRCIQAIDYAHRKLDGSVEKFADSLKTEFKTKAGRKVFDGAGLDPDIIVSNVQTGAITFELVNSAMIFEYATQYCSEHPEVPVSMKSFKVTEVEYDKFKAWLTTKDFTYTSELEQQMDELIKTAKNQRSYAELQDQLTSLKQKITSSRATDLVRFKDEIKRALEMQIAFHYKLNEGQTEVSLEGDPEIIETKRILSDNSVYKKLLLPH